MAERSRWAPGAAALADAARAVASVSRQGRSSDDVLRPFDDLSRRSAVRAIALGTLRWYLRLAPAVDALLSHPKGLDDEVRALLIASAHQIEYSRNAPQATVHAAVDATRLLKQGRASSLVNAVLRRFVAERRALLERVDRNIAGRTAHPEWLVKQLEQAWPDRYAAILEANNEHPPLVLRVDLTRSSVAGYLGQLAEAEIPARALGWSPAAVRVDRPVPVSDLPGFDAGLVSVQDAGAQVAAPLLDVRAGMRVLDACAAPGGKTGHLLEIGPQLAELVAIDVDPGRVELIRATLARLGRTATVQVADAREPGSFWDGRPFERILVDAPCSSTGVIRRHPDIKLLRRAADVPAFARTQEQILAASFRMLAPGGRLLYATCSLLPAENDEVVGRFLAGEPGARVVPLPTPAEVAPGAVGRAAGIQLVPGAEAGTDGFYYACLEKTTTGT